MSLSPERIAELREYASMNTGDLSRTITLGDLVYLLTAADDAARLREDLEIAHNQVRRHERTMEALNAAILRGRARVARLEAALDRAVDAIHHAQMCACLCGECVRRFNALAGDES